MAATVGKKLAISFVGPSLGAYVAASVACGPTAPSAANTGVQIEPITSVLHVSQSVRFALTVDGRPLAATWTSSNPAVLAIERDGRAEALKVGTATVSATAESSTAMREMSIVPDYRGRWTGLMRMSCQRISGRGPIPCSPDARYQITLELDQNFTTVSGSINLFREPTIGRVAGEILENYHLTLQGAARNAEHHGEFRIEQWDTYLDEAGERMLGRWTSDSKFWNGFGPQHRKEEYELLDVRRTRE